MTMVAIARNGKVAISGWNGTSPRHYHPYSIISVSIIGGRIWLLSLTSFRFMGESIPTGWYKNSLMDFHMFSSNKEIYWL
jgi:hypothetical protein